MSFIRRRLTYANVVMTVALVFAMSAGAYAAGKYIITSTKQIKPSVLKELKGKAGPRGVAGTIGARGPEGAPGKDGNAGSVGERGPAGPSGTKGATGATGPTGAPWPVPGTLPSNATETGTWGVAAVPGSFASGALNIAFSPISFNVPLKERVKVNVIAVGGKGAGGGTCPTTSEVAKPQAEPGNLCVFSNEAVANVSEVSVGPPDNASGEPEAGTSGAIIAVKPETKGEPVLASGTWAVTSK